MGLLNKGLNVGSRALNSRAAPAAGVALGLGVAMDRADMGTYSMDFIEDSLLGTTNADEAFTGRQLSVTSPLSFAAKGMVTGAFTRGFNMLSPFADITMPPPPLGNLSDPISSIKDSLSDSRMSPGELRMRGTSPRHNRASNQAIDGSLVFGMFNLRR